MPCVIGARFNMEAAILRQVTGATDPDEVDETGEWVLQQDPDSGEIIRVWHDGSTGEADDPDTPEDESVSFDTFPCIARGIIDGGIRVAGTTERFSEIYENVDYVKISFPGWVKLSKRDRVTNIKDSNGIVVWKEEELPDAPPTVFSVMGVTPIVDPYGVSIENTAMLERAEIQ